MAFDSRKQGLIVTVGRLQIYNLSMFKGKTQIIILFPYFHICKCSIKFVHFSVSAGLAVDLCKILAMDFRPRLFQNLRIRLYQRLQIFRRFVHLAEYYVCYQSIMTRDCKSKLKSMFPNSICSECSLTN